MARRLAVAVVVAALALALAGCGIDEDVVADGPRPEPTTTTGPSGTTAPGPGVEADDLLLDVEDLGSDWSAAGTDALPEIPSCAETSGTAPSDHGQAVFVRGGPAQVLVQTVAVFASEEQARTAVAGFAADVESCDNPAIDVEDLSLPEHGDEQVTARLAVGEPVLDATVDLVCVRVGTVTTVLSYVNLVSPDSEDLPAIVDEAVAKL